MYDAASRNASNEPRRQRINAKEQLSSKGPASPAETTTKMHPVHPEAPLKRSMRVAQSAQSGIEVYNLDTQHKYSSHCNDVLRSTLDKQFAKGKRGR